MHFNINAVFLLAIDQPLTLPRKTHSSHLKQLMYVCGVELLITCKCQKEQMSCQLYKMCMFRLEDTEISAQGTKEGLQILKYKELTFFFK